MNRTRDTITPVRPDGRDPLAWLVKNLHTTVRHVPGVTRPGTVHEQMQQTRESGVSPIALIHLWMDDEQITRS